MGQLNVPVPKGAKGAVLEVETDLIPEAMLAEVWMQGIKAILGRGQTKITKALFEGNVEKMQAAALAKAQENLQALYDGKIKVTGAKQAGKRPAEVNREAMSLAKKQVKADMKKAGLKSSHYKSADITAAAHQYLDADPSFYETAEANVKAMAEKAETSPTKIDLASILKVDPALKAKADKANEKRRNKPAEAGQLSAKQAGKPRQRPQPQA